MAELSPLPPVNFSFYQFYLEKLNIFLILLPLQKFVYLYISFVK